MAHKTNKAGGSRRQTLKRLLLSVVAIYVLVCIGCASWQRSLIYYPPHFPAERVDESAQQAGMERWRDAAGHAIGMKRLSARQPAAGKLLIVYGNGSWSVGCAHYADDLQRVVPFDVFILEYPGYADRAGKPTERNLFQAADEAWPALGTNQPVYVLGESLGSGVAAYLAGTHPGQVAGMILLSPYNRLAGPAHTRMPFLPVSLLLVDRFASEDYLKPYHGPVGIVVDGCDTIVPEKFGRLLFNGYGGPKQLWEFPAGQHIQVMESPGQFWREVVSFWQTNRPVQQKP